MRTRGNAFIVTLVVLVAMVAMACSSSPSSDNASTDSAGGDSATTVSPADADPYVGFTSDQYTGDTNWLCRPGKAASACDNNLDATAINGDGTTTVKPFTKAADPPIDCFYVYPTISGDKGANSDLNAGDEEKATVEGQAARFAEHCRVFAPVYRQIPLAALSGALSGKPSSQSTTTTAAGAQSPGDIAYGDVLAAWKQYIAHDNHGRGVVLIGHSQGTGHLIHLMKEEIDPNPALRSRLVSAILLGGTVAVPAGADVGGTFANIPLCRAEDQTGCAVTYQSFRATAPPPVDSFFGKPRNGGDGVAGCTNPAAISGGSGSGDAYFRNDRAWLRNDKASTPITTRWVELPGLMTLQCQEKDGFNYLEVTLNTDSASPRVDTIPGDLTPQWGLHVVDFNVALGNLVDLVGAQAAAYQSSH